MNAQHVDHTRFIHPKSITCSYCAKIWKLCPNSVISAISSSKHKKIVNKALLIKLPLCIWDEGGLCCIHYVVRLKEEERKKPQGTANIV